jgi:hypothetical protein
MKDEALKLAKECGATTYTNRHYPEATAVTFSPVAWEKFCEQALAAPVLPVAWAEYHYKKGRFTGLTTNDINAVDSVGDGCQWVPQLQALAQPAVQEPVAWHDKIKGMEVSMDVSTGDDDIDHRVYGQVYEVILAHEAGPDVILAIESERNFTTPPAAPVPVEWTEMVTANLVREGVNKHKARELAAHFYGLAQPAPVQPVWIQPDHLQKAQKAPFLCRVEPHKRDDFVPLHTTPPEQPAVPDAIHHTDLSESLEYIQGWNDCRAEMLKGMKP